MKKESSKSCSFALTIRRQKPETETETGTGEEALIKPTGFRALTPGQGSVPKVSIWRLVASNNVFAVYPFILLTHYEATRPDTRLP